MQQSSTEAEFPGKGEKEMTGLASLHAKQLALPA